MVQEQDAPVSRGVRKCIPSSDSSLLPSPVRRKMSSTTKSGPKQATVEDRYTKPPVLTEGDLTPEVAKDYETACRDFFDTKEIEEGDQVRRLLVGIKDHWMRDWILGQHDVVVKLSFSEFMTEI